MTCSLSFDKIVYRYRIQSGLEVIKIIRRVPSSIMFRLPFGERVDPLEEKRQARENTIQSLVTFCVLCAAIRIAPVILEHSGFS